MTQHRKLTGAIHRLDPPMPCTSDARDFDGTWWPWPGDVVRLNCTYQSMNPVRGLWLVHGYRRDGWATAAGRRNPAYVTTKDGEWLVSVVVELCEPCEHGINESGNLGFTERSDAYNADVSLRVQPWMCELDAVHNMIAQSRHSHGRRIHGQRSKSAK